ncbi:hypothetical protein [Rhizobium leguminosarum]|uniref:hypothetical protein n=1 Tax=Rhizobium leguminosarum TaxID=384 RepID=UPI0024B3947C|nr:hypothetical protein [Rhizobium leguminosarum]WHO80488.1 hypothetical protein QMO81_003203 [Rhizobium leguminosarum]
MDSGDNSEKWSNTASKAMTFAILRRYFCFEQQRAETMSKLTRAEVFQRFEAALAILGEEDCEDAQADLRMKNLRNLVKWASQDSAVNLHNVANDVVAN